MTLHNEYSSKFHKLYLASAIDAYESLSTEPGDAVAEGESGEDVTAEELERSLRVSGAESG